MRDFFKIFKYLNGLFGLGCFNIRNNNMNLHSSSTYIRGKQDKFDEIFKEIKRQFDVLSGFDSSHDSKIGIFLGFIILAIVYLLTYDKLGERFLATNLSSGVFFVSLIIIGYSFYAAIKAYSMKKFGIGPDILPIIEDYRKGKNIDFRKKIARGIFDAKERNSSIIKNKIGYMKRMMTGFIIGFALIVLSFLISVLKLEVILNVG